MGMVVQHNLPAINAHRQMGINSNSLSKSLEKLSSGFAINRAADNAAGLAISEKMRGQINGLNQASKNAQDGISLIQTAEGALNETHSILQRMRELSVQSANGTYQDEVDRENISKEVEALKSEIDRISTSTHYNNIKLLDGSLSSTGATGTSYGAKFGIEVPGSVGAAETSLTMASGSTIEIKNNTDKAYKIEIVAGTAANPPTAALDGDGETIKVTLHKTDAGNNTEAAIQAALDALTAGGGDLDGEDITFKVTGDVVNADAVAGLAVAGKGDVSGFAGASVTSNVGGVEIKTNATGASKGGENASWSEDGKTLTLNLAENTTYTQAQIDDLIKNADVSKVATGNPADVTVKLNNGIFANGSTDTTTGKTVAGVRSASGATNIGSMTAKGNYADQITITSNNYGKEYDKNFKIIVDAEAGKESVSTTSSTLVSGVSHTTVPTSTAGAVEWANNAAGGFKADITYGSKATTDGIAIDAVAALADADHAAGSVVANFDPANGKIVLTVYGEADNSTAGAGKLVDTDISEDAINKALSDLLTKEGGDPSQNTLGVTGITVSGGLKIKGGDTPQAAVGVIEGGAATNDAASAGTTTEYQEIHLASGVEYTEQDIQNILKKAGLDYSVSLTDSQNYDGSNTVKFDVKNTNGVSVSTSGGAGVGANTGATNTGEGLVFQIGANGSADQRVALNVDDMSSTGIGVKAISVGTREAANAAIDVIDKAINQVSGTRADLGALQNRLEHTINSLDVASENLTASESRIRDVDMAKEMMQFSKSQILSQASQAMLAQANTLPQGVLQLLQ